MEQTASGRIIGRSILRYTSVTSTNDIARGLASQQADEGTVVVAAEQTLGRGSRGRSWISPPDSNLLMSVILRPDLSLERVGELAFVASLAVARYLIESVGLPAMVKWPNDIRVNGKKIAGILIEAVPGAIRGSASAIVGIGLNVNWAYLPDDLAAAATSIFLEKNEVFELDVALDGVVTSLDATYDRYKRDGFSAVLADWRLLDCLEGSEVKVALNGETLSGVAESVAADGSLVVRLQDGSLRNISAAGLIVD